MRGLRRPAPPAHPPCSRGVAEQQRDEIGWHLAAAQKLRGRVDTRARGALLSRGTIGGLDIHHERINRSSPR
jgi:hypothetical protein